MYTDLMNKLHPNELKRIDLIQKKYQKNKTDYPTTSSSSASINSRSLQNLVLIGQASRPQSATCKRFQQSHSSTSQAQNSERNSTVSDILYCNLNIPYNDNYRRRFK
ncbi:unnamed protein product [Trichobilharzia regenti]|nr:unnamed protein product [Trichobilharzia regenti]